MSHKAVVMIHFENLQKIKGDRCIHKPGVVQKYQVHREKMGYLQVRPELRFPGQDLRLLVDQLLCYQL